MSKEFLQFTAQYGIQRQHSTWNRSQQNSLAERANRTMGDHITVMLAESELPFSFWGHCIVSIVHVWNRLPTASLSNTTPFEAFYTDVFYFRVWECTAYVYIQKDKYNFLQPHVEKYIFIEYSSGYKGWLFYNPTIHQTCISEWAKFDERYFSCLSGSEYSTVPSFVLSAPPTTSTQSTSPPPLLGPLLLSDKGGDDDLLSKRPVEPKSTLVTLKASPKILLQVGDTPDESDDNLPYATSIGPEPSRTPSRAPILLLQPPSPPRHSSCNPVPRRAY